MTTVTAVKRAVEEVFDREEPGTNTHAALLIVASNPRLLTDIANRLSDRGDAGNDAARRNLHILRLLFKGAWLTATEADALEWAIDQLTPPERA